MPEKFDSDPWIHAGSRSVFFPTLGKCSKSITLVSNQAEKEIAKVVACSGKLSKI